MKELKVIAFDADDTLWENETFFRDAEKQFAIMFKDLADEDTILKALYTVEMANMPIYGYGIKAFVLSLIETANKITHNQIKAEQVDAILQMGKEMLNKPVELLSGVEEVLKALHGKYCLIVATKGDLLDQERKLRKSGLLKYFHHIEVMSDKNTDAYKALLKHLDIQAEELLMIGNSIKSDILPVIEIGARAIHVPFHTTWHHELVDEPIQSDLFYEVKEIKEVLPIVFQND